MTAESKGDKKGTTAATLRFSEEIKRITLNGFQELQALEQQANSLKLTEHEVAELLEALRTLCEEIFKTSSEQPGRRAEIAINNDQDADVQMQQA